MEKSKLSQVLGVVLGIVVLAYGIQLLLILPVYSGMVCRHERAMWVWEEFARVHEKRGIGAALLEVYCYLIFYSGLFVVPFMVTTVYYTAQDGEGKLCSKDQVLLAAMISAWIASTFLLFPESVIQFLHYLPWGGPGEWLIIGWVAARLYIVYFGNGVAKSRLRAN